MNGAIPAASRSGPISARIGHGRSAEWETRGFCCNRHERIDRRRVENRVVFVSGKEKSLLAAVVKRQLELATKREPGIVFRQAAGATARAPYCSNVFALKKSLRKK